MLIEFLRLFLFLLTYTRRGRTFQSSSNLASRLLLLKQGGSKERKNNGKKSTRLSSRRRVLTVFVILQGLRGRILALLAGRSDPHDFLPLTIVDFTHEWHVTGSSHASPAGVSDLKNQVRVSSFGTNRNRRLRWVPRSPFLRPPGRRRLVRPRQRSHR